MFSGIIKDIAIASKIEKGTDFLRVTIPVPKKWKIAEGESINIDGVCSTVEKIQRGTFSVFYMAETLRKTNFSNTTLSHKFNLERSLTLQSLIGGHLVSGHVDTTANLSSIKKEGDARVLEFKIAPKFTKYIIYKGSICINGVSLTVVSVFKNSFTVSLIPYTLSHTNLGDLKKGDVVNIEVDLIAKYLEKLA
jgi:riboflavin synthase